MRFIDFFLKVVPLTTYRKLHAQYYIILAHPGIILLDHPVVHVKATAVIDLLRSLVVTSGSVPLSTHRL